MCTVRSQEENMSVMCAWASIDERGKIKGGAAGDQTGREVKCGPIYHFGQTAVYRCKDRSAALRIGAAARAIADNDCIGYDQGQRTTAYTALENAGWVVAEVAQMVEIDCSELAACAVNTAYKKALIPSYVYSGNIGNALITTGAFDRLTATKYLGKSEYIQCGDIIVAPGKHVIVAYTDGARANITNGSTVINGIVKAGNAIIKKGQRHAIEFTGVKIQTDGISGPETNRMKARVLQHALNLDYKAGLVEDGIFGNASRSALGSHYVEKWERQYMVTAAEILSELNGYDPKGVEYPGIYGNGLVNAVREKLGGNGLKLPAAGFLQLI